MDEFIKELEQAIEECSMHGENNHYVMKLSNLASKAVGALKVYGDINIKNLMVGISRLSAAGGDYLSDDLT